MAGARRTGRGGFGSREMRDDPGGAAWMLEPEHAQRSTRRSDAPVESGGTTGGIPHSEPEHGCDGARVGCRSDLPEGLTIKGLNIDEWCARSFREVTLSEHPPRAIEGAQRTSATRATKPPAKNDVSRPGISSLIIHQAETEPSQKSEQGTPHDRTT